MEGKTLMYYSLVVALVSLQMLTITYPRVAEAAISCGDAVSTLAPCGGYLVGAGAKPSGSCCSAVRNLNGMAKTPELRRSLCECLRQTGPSFGVKPAKARALPSECGVDINIAVSPNVDCSKA